MGNGYAALNDWFLRRGVTPVFIRLKGYAKGNVDYKEAKKPIEPDWTHAKGLSSDELDAWIKKDGWIGLVVPQGYIVLDIDDKKIFQHVQARLHAKRIKHIAINTPNGGQLFFKDTGKVKTQQAKTICAGGINIDYRIAGKGQIVMPTDNTVDRYLVHVDDDLERMPLFFIPVMRYDSGKHQDKILPVPIMEGGRDDTLFRHACRLREWDSCYSLKLSKGGLKEVLHQINCFLCEPPMEEKEVDAKTAQALTYPVSSKPKTEKEKSPTQAELLIAIGERLILFHDDTGEAYAELNGHNIKVRGGNFKQWLSRQLWLQEKKAPNSDSLNQAINILEAKACFEGKQRTLHNRVARHEGAIYYDLADGRAVKITPGDWRVVSDPPMIFKRYTHQRAQVEPKAGGRLQHIVRFLNIPDEEMQLLTQVLLVSYFVPDIGHPIMCAWGDQGSGKTTDAYVFKSLIDPSKLGVFFAPRDLGETIQTFEHHYFVAFDNLSDIQDWFSDLLAQVVTGAGLSKRRLYTDDEDIIYQVRRCACINGINQLISRPDAMDRSILLHHTRIEPSERRTERELYAEFEHYKPYILGGVFDALANALAIYPTIYLSELPRMADFTLWGCAIAQALGHTQEAFLHAYRGNIKGQHIEIIGFNTLAQAVLKLMDGKAFWNGTVGDAYAALTEIAHPTKKDRTYPAAPNKLRRHLERIRPTLSEYNIKFEIDDYHTEHGVLLHFQRMGILSSVSSDIQTFNNTNGLQTEHTAEDNNGEQVSSGVSTVKNINNINKSEHPEHPEHKNETFWNVPQEVRIC